MATSDTTTSASTRRRPTESSEETSTTADANTATQVTQAVLSPVGGGSASGVAIFGRVKNSLALQVEAEGLEPTAKGQSYTVWLADSPQKMLPLASTEVPKSGKIAAQFEVPTEVLAYLAKGTFDQIVVTLTTERRAQSLADQGDEGKEVAGLHRHRRPARHRSPARSSAPRSKKRRE